jgi:hypothetical protein
MGKWETVRSDVLFCLAIFALACGGFFCLGSLASAYAHKPEDSAAYLCGGVEHGPRRSGVDLPSAEFNEGSKIRGHWSVWPMGIECTWKSTLTGREVTYQAADWPATWIMVMGLTATALGAGAGLRVKHLNRADFNS